MILDEIGKRGQIKRKYYQRVLPENPTKDYYYIMRETPNTTSLLIEYGFIDNKNDQKKLENNLLNYVEGVIEAVSNYIGIQYVPPKQIDENISSDLYVVKKGDTLYKIANIYNTTINELKNINQLTSDNLFIGQNLKIPSNQDNFNNNYQEYIVLQGDTLSKIANQYDVSVNDLISFNELPTTILKINQIIKIPQNNKNNLIYTVKKGDTLYKIANDFETSVNSIKKLNNLNSNLLNIGQDLIIPPKNIVEETDFIVYQVKPNDTLYSIAKKYNTTPDEIKHNNNLVNDNLIIGDILQIPSDSIQTDKIIYTIKPGDTLYKIANSYKTTVLELMNANNLSSTLLSIGDTIVIPNEKNDF